MGHPSLAAAMFGSGREEGRSPWLSNLIKIWLGPLAS
jgi:hypothetical protein